MSFLADYLVVGGGGGAGGQVGGGGGGGEVDIATGVTLASASYSITIGAGGLGAASTSNAGLVGASTTAFGVTSLGGGGGAGFTQAPAVSGANGGGGSAGASFLSGIVGTVGGTGGDGLASPLAGGGGSAPNNDGANGAIGQAGAGAEGDSNDYKTGSSQVYGSGGGGGGFSGQSVAGGAGGTNAGNGDGGSGGTGASATANFGGGGGAGSAGGACLGGNGGSGVVVIRYLTADFISGAGGTIQTVGAYTVHTFTTNGTLTSPVASASPPTSVATGTPTDTTIPLTWVDDSLGVYYFIYQSTSEFGTYTYAGLADQGDQAFTARGLATGTQYFFKIKTQNSAGALTGFSSIVNATTTAPTGPTAGTALTLVSQSATEVALSWTIGANTTAQHVMRAPISSAGVTGAFVKINDAVITSGTTYTDSVANSTPDPVAGTSYMYAVKPFNGSLEGTWTNTTIGTFVTAVTRIEGDFEDDLASSFIVLTDFGETVTYTAFGGSPTAITAIYDAESTEVDPDTGDVRSSNPQVQCATKDVPLAGNKDLFTISGNVFTVRNVMPDGTGMTTITLTRDA